MARNLFRQAAAYRKKHKGMTMPQAVKAVSRMGGAAISEVGKTHRKKRRRRVGMLMPPSSPVCAVTGTRHKRRRRVGKLVKVTGTKHHHAKGTAVTQARKIQTIIDRLEDQRKQCSSRQLKDIYALQINKEHYKLANIEKRLRAR